ncbi:hypothetical protein [Dysosmobacter sp.]|uniref:hypothetical protein n=1 Tax=Dysosmobacter sp. TaxID=2591382 RepID=UPI003AF15D9C
MGFNFRKRGDDVPLDVPDNPAQDCPEVQPAVVEAPVQDSEMARDLLTFIAGGIEAWAQKYHLENMPKDIVFSQAMVILRRTEEMMRQGRR